MCRYNRLFSPAGTNGSPSTVERQSTAQRRESVQVNVTPTLGPDSTTGGQGITGTHSDTPEIRKYKKRFNSEILCAALWGVNLLIGTENGLMLLDRSGQGKVYQLISRRRFQQMEVLEGQNILVTISGKKCRVRVYYLSWLKSKILRTDSGNQLDKRNGFINVGDLEGAVHFKIGNFPSRLIAHECHTSTHKHTNAHTRTYTRVCTRRKHGRVRRTVRL